MVLHRGSAWLGLSILLVAGSAAVGAAAVALPAQIDLSKMKTSIYIGTVTLTTSAFIPVDETYTATYKARVSPWAFWNEAGSITLKVNPDDYERLLRGETITMTGEAKNGKGRLRTISAKAVPVDATTGRIKIRVTASGTTLVFNTTYVVSDTSAGAATD